MSISLHQAEVMRAQIKIAQEEEIESLAAGHAPRIGKGATGIYRNVQVPWFCRLINVHGVGWMARDIRDGAERFVI